MPYLTAFMRETHRLRDLIGGRSLLPRASGLLPFDTSQIFVKNLWRVLFFLGKRGVELGFPVENVGVHLLVVFDVTCNSP